MDSNTSALSILFLSFILAVAWYVRYSSVRRFPLPPGPKPKPLLGNLLDMPSGFPWLVYDQWRKTYGDIIHINVLGQPIIILGSQTRMSDIFEKRSAIYSDRIRLPMINELMGFDFSFAFMRYGTWWRRHRRMFNSHFNPTAANKYRPVHIKEARALLGRLLVTPENFMHHIHQALSATIMSAVYDIDITKSHDPFLDINEKTLALLVEAGETGTFLVDILPILKYVPYWLPGAKFKRQAAYCKRQTIDLVERPFQAIKENMIRGTGKPCAMVNMLESLPEDRSTEEEQVVKNCAAVAYMAGADTTVSAAHTFILAMAMYPEVQQKAQAEIDAVIGQNRLPDFEDRPSLPYINAIMKELMRWQVVTPLGIAHASTADDVYDGYFIPKGAIIVGNSWAILHDPKMYPDPEEFKPERFLKLGVLDPTVHDPYTAAFGFGRRICPGRHFADNSLYSVVVSVLSVFNILAPLDDHGNVIQLKPDMTSGLASYPRPFQVIIKPRSPAAETLIKDSL